jgi:hypothetical protein
MKNYCNSFITLAPDKLKIPSLILAKKSMENEYTNVPKLFLNLISNYFYKKHENGGIVSTSHLNILFDQN